MQKPPCLRTFPNFPLITGTFHPKLETFLPLAPQHKEKAHLPSVPWLAEGRQIHFMSFLGKARVNFPHHCPFICRRTFNREGRSQPRLSDQQPFPALPSSSLGTAGKDRYCSAHRAQPWRFLQPLLPRYKFYTQRNNNRFLKYNSQVLQFLF